MSNISKIILGTVQFGCQYGINSVGRPSTSQVAAILQEAQSGGISVLDTSSAYGDAEFVLGEVNASNNFKIVSKFPKAGKSVSETFEKSLRILNTNHLYGYLLHNFEVYQSDPSVWDEFISLQDQGKTDSIGFSLYEPSELDLILKNKVKFNLLQIPYNIFDRQFEPYFARLKDMGVEIHVRSTFLQGLFFKDRNTLPDKLIPLKHNLLELDAYAEHIGLTVGEVALNYNLQNTYIDGVLMGVDNQEQLAQNFKFVCDKKIECDFKIENQKLLKPVNWK
ncbi:aldo/keto reductase [Bacteroides heparinolyticus]|uniref:Putative LPS biosynthesis aldo/keto reductase n=1 Tax=Prevotella heparinolytica TaxID=28113 RepID=A0A449I7P9_9BACE|nr:aldo/keto reductase [Bacteroides heparinolyticus]MCI6213162.1 aldo/keto reductase [Bacteroides heparinolyticus]VFB15459.1 putative LPS biosynthesis aldo/keto reductase [Bacteroides heparinolyticus]